MSQHNEQFAHKLFYLTRVSYNESKAEVLVEFSNKDERFVQRHRFFPFIAFSGIESEKLTSLVLSLGFRGFSVEENNSLVFLRSRTFSDLKKISNSIALYTRRKPIVLEPERCFLVERDWSYFDAFERIDDLLFKLNLVVESNESRFKQIDLGFFLTREIPFSEALVVNEEDSLFLVEQAAWSNLLCVPIHSVPRDLNDKIELFIENSFFKHGESIVFEESEGVFSSKDYNPFSRDPTSRIDFSRVWVELFSNNFFNIGPETKNCSCCSPITLDSRNLLPSSLIRVRFIDDNSFFESVSESFALDFHNEHDGKDIRVNKKKEFFLNSFPVGPFSAGDSELIPIMDAKRLIRDGKATLISGVTESSLVSLHELNWFCLKKESFFSKDVRFLNAKLFTLKKLIDSFESKLFVDSFAYLYSKYSFSILNNVLSGLPSQLTNPKSKFFSTSLAKNILSIQEATISKFKEFSEKEGYRVLFAGKTSACVKGFASLKLAKGFSRQENIPQPQISGFVSKRMNHY